MNSKQFYTIPMTALWLDIWKWMQLSTVFNRNTFGTICDKLFKSMWQIVKFASEKEKGRKTKPCEPSKSISPSRKSELTLWARYQKQHEKIVTLLWQWTTWWNGLKHELYQTWLQNQLHHFSTKTLSVDTVVRKKSFQIMEVLLLAKWLKVY